ncbi:hypothetical protein ZPR_0146 [Zunongwangia profunda SM-A87]|uniref:Uncharacterized protein n=1 Tax=Zunongwangia profunda (strain DSM 18752 / CCTCC AB 206139 / SM-A87) TaxID=655815 RepID=D5BCJ6_ZUNPS|nr:hypothetical protein ZPR_0146 [Zunongwangia profunda SM-A87]
MAFKKLILEKVYITNHNNFWKVEVLLFCINGLF